MHGTLPKQLNYSHFAVYMFWLLFTADRELKCSCSCVILTGKIVRNIFRFPFQLRIHNERMKVLTLIRV